MRPPLERRQDNEAMLHSLGPVAPVGFTRGRSLACAMKLRRRQPWSGAYVMRLMGVSWDALRAHGIDPRAVAEGRV